MSRFIPPSTRQSWFRSGLVLAQYRGVHALGCCALLVAGCADIPGGQIVILGDTVHTTFEGNGKVLDGKYGDAEGGFTIEEGYAGVVEINIGEPDEETGIVDGSDFPKVTPVGVSISVVADSEDRRWLVTVFRESDGTLPSTTYLEVSDADYQGSIRIPVRVVAQANAGTTQDPLPWPYGSGTSSSSSSSSATTGATTSASTTASATSSSSSSSGGGGGGQ